MRFLLLTLLCFSTIGCDEILDKIRNGDDLPDFGSGAVPTANVSGNWLLTGDGSLTECADDRFNIGSYALTSLALEVQQDAVSGTLSVTNRTGENSFAFTEASVDGRAVRFTITEGSGEQAIRLEFSGSFESADNQIRGAFAGEGPAECSNRGNFTVAVVGTTFDGGAPGGNSAADGSVATDATDAGVDAAD